MKVFEYYGKILESGQLSLPTEIRKRLPAEGKVRVMVFPDGTDAWEETSIHDILDAYGQEDGIYDSI